MVRDPAAETIRGGGELEAEETDGADLRDVLGMSSRRAPPRLTPGQVIDDAYQIVEELGAGGMGRVYRARDLRLDRDVAIKLHMVALSEDDDSLRREATALARLAHPNVVTVYEVGTWSGHPWVAMECVTGGTARTWLAARRRTARQIIALFVAAGRGLAAAHSASLIHRDFKPDNVLVGEDGRARVADFGLARSHGPPAADAGSADPLATRSGVVRGTPAYMAPEQHAGEEVGPGADQFAFAVALWEALAGARPFGDSVPAEGAAIARPPGGTMPRHVEVALRRALSIAPADRWPTLDALLDELARDPARRRRQVIAASVAGLALAGGGWGLARSRGAPAISCEPTTDELAEVWSAARRDSLAARLGDPDLAQRALASVDTWTGRWRQARVAACTSTHVNHEQSEALLDLKNACLDRARSHLSAALAVADEPKVTPTQAVAELAALPYIEDCADPIALSGGSAPPSDPQGAVAIAMGDVLIARATALRNAGQQARALAAGREAVAYADAIDHPATAARARVQLATSMMDTGKTDGVLAMFEDAARLASRAKDDGLVARIWMNVCDIVAVRLERPGEGERLIAVAEAAVARVGTSDFYDGLLAGIRGDLALQRNDPAAAIPLLERRIKTQRATYGADDPALARWHNRLATALSAVHRPTDARAHLDEAIAILERRYGPKHPNLGVLLTTRGTIEYQSGAFEDAAKTYRRALELKESTLGPAHPSLAPTLVNLALVEADLADHDGALASARRAVELVEKALPPNHPRVGGALAIRGRMELEAGKWAEASDTLDRAMKILEPLGERPPLDESLRGLAQLRVHDQHLDAARQLAERALAIATTAYGPSLDTAHALTDLAKIDAAAGKLDAARAGMERARDMARTAVGPSHPDVRALEALLAAVPR